MEEQYRFWEEEAKYTPISAEEAHERNELSSDRLKVLYPGYKDFVSNMDRFLSLYEKHASEDFNSVIRKLISDYLKYEGYSLYSDEKQYMKAMLHINRAKKSLSIQEVPR